MGKGRLGDGICDEVCNNAACGNGDCLDDPAQKVGWASENCHKSWVGDGVCDIGCYQLRRRRRRGRRPTCTGRQTTASACMSGRDGKLKGGSVAPLARERRLEEGRRLEETEEVVSEEVRTRVVKPHQAPTCHASAADAAVAATARCVGDDCARTAVVLAVDGCIVEPVIGTIVCTVLSDAVSGEEVGKECHGLFDTPVSPDDDEVHLAVPDAREIDVPTAKLPRAACGSHLELRATVCRIAMSDVRTRARPPSPCTALDAAGRRRRRPTRAPRAYKWTAPRRATTPRRRYSRAGRVRRRAGRVRRRAGRYGAAQGGYDAAQGGHDAAQGGYDAAQGGYTPRRRVRRRAGRYDAAQGGYDAAQGGYDAAQGGYDAAQGGYDAAGRVRRRAGRVRRRAGGTTPRRAGPTPRRASTPKDVCGSACQGPEDASKPSAPNVRRVVRMTATVATAAAATASAAPAAAATAGPAGQPATRAARLWLLLGQRLQRGIAVVVAAAAATGTAAGAAILGVEATIHVLQGYPDANSVATTPRRRHVPQARQIEVDGAVVVKTVLRRLPAGAAVAAAVGAADAVAARRRRRCRRRRRRQRHRRRRRHRPTRRPLCCPTRRRACARCASFHRAVADAAAADAAASDAAAVAGTVAAAASAGVHGPTEPAAAAADAAADAAASDAGRRRGPRYVPRHGRLARQQGV